MNEKDQERWSRMLEDPVPEVQVRALTEIGRVHFRPQDTVGEPPKEAFLGAVPAKGPVEPGLPSWLRDAILEKLKADDPVIRAEAALALVHWRDEKTIGPFLESLSDPDSTARLAVVQALAIWGETRFIPELLEVAQRDSEELVRAHALSAIEGMRQGGVVKKEEEPVAAVRARGPVGSVAEILKRIADSDPSSYVAFLARRVRKRFASSE